MAYTAASVILAETESDGRLHLEIEYTGNAGEPVLVRPFYIQAASLANLNDYVRAEAKRQLDIMNGSRSIAAQIQPFLPYSLDVTTPLPATAQSTSSTFVCATAAFTPGATPQDVFGLTGASGKTVQVIGAGISTTQTTAGNNTWTLLKRSTVNTGGTFQLQTPVRASGSGAAAANCATYTANPTAGTLDGRIWTGRVSSPAPANSGVGSSNVFLDMLRNIPITLASGEMVAWNFNGVALPAGLSVTAWFAWVETT